VERIKGRASSPNGATAPLRSASTSSVMSVSPSAVRRVITTAPAPIATSVVVVHRTTQPRSTASRCCARIPPLDARDHHPRQLVVGAVGAPIASLAASISSPRAIRGTVDVGAGYCRRGVNSSSSSRFSRRQFKFPDARAPQWHRLQLTDSAEFTLRRDLLINLFRSSSVMPWIASSIFTPRRCKSRSC